VTGGNVKQLGGRYFDQSELLNAGFARVGKNVKVHSHANIYGLENIEIGDDTRIDDFALIVATGALKIGRNVSVHSHSFIGSRFGVEINNFSTLAPGVKIFSSSDDYTGEFMTGPTVSPEKLGGDSGLVVIDEHVIIGAGTIILPNVTIKQGVSVGALSLVKSDLESWTMYAGIPAMKIGNRKRDLLQLAEDL
jgi:galactoside O-acetyltransferase